MIKDYSLSKISKETNKNIIRQENLVKEGKLLPVCYRCVQVPNNGLYDGFRVEGMFFCSNCQQELFEADQDSPEYQEYLFLVKGLLFNTGQHV